MRHVLNFFITAVVVWLFEQVGWIHINQQIAPFPNEMANQLLVAGIIGLIFSIVITIATFAFFFFAVVTAGCGCLLFPVYIASLGMIGFWALAQILPGWVTVTTNPFQVFVMGLALAIVRIHSTSSSK